MKQSEKLDALLLQLYHHKYDGRWYSINQLFADKEITLANEVEVLVTATRLVSDGLINARTTENDISAMITGDGITFCETTSFSVPGVSLASLSQEKIYEKITSLRKTVYFSGIEDDLKNDILQCLTEISAVISLGKMPLFCLSQLYALTLAFPLINQEAIELQEIAKSM